MQAALPAWGMRREKKTISRSEGTRRRERHKWFSPHWRRGGALLPAGSGLRAREGQQPCSGRRLSLQPGTPSRDCYLPGSYKGRRACRHRADTWNLEWEEKRHLAKTTPESGFSEPFFPWVILRPRARILLSPFSENHYPRYLIKFLILQVPQMICDLSLARIPFTLDVLS